MTASGAAGSERVTVSVFSPSVQQSNIFAFPKDFPGQSLVVRARAGTGKTTTLVQMVRHIPDGMSKLIKVLAFNKNIATELQSKMPIYIQVSTWHSLCLNSLQRSLPRRPRIDGNKVFSILKENLSYRDNQTYGKFVNRLIGFAKNAGIGTNLLADEEDSWFTLIDHFNLIGDTEDFDMQQAVQIASQTLGVSNDMIEVVDFDDMIYMALLRNVTFDKNNYVLLDEAQDTNGVQRALLHRMLAAPSITLQPMTEEPDSKTLMTRTGGGVLIAVGDDAQSIYGFRGADSDAMELLKSEFNCEELPLSVSYRCSKAVVREAQKVLERIYK